MCGSPSARPLRPGDGESTNRYAERIERAVAELADEATTDWWQSRRRAADGTTPPLTGPDAPGLAAGLGPRRPLPQAPPADPRLAEALGPRPALLHEAQAGGRDARLRERKVHHELGAMRREDVLAQQHRPPVGVRRDALAAQHRDPAGTSSTAASRASTTAAPIVCTAPPSGWSMQLVERHALDVGARQVRAQLLGAPHRDAGEGLAVGQVQPSHLQHGGHAEHLADAGRRRDEAEVEDAALGAHPLLGQLRLDGAQPSERLAERVDRREPAEPLARVHQPLVAQQLERLADRDPAGLVRCGQLRLRGRVRPAANSPASTRRRSSSAIAR